MTISEQENVLCAQLQCSHFPSLRHHGLHSWYAENCNEKSAFLCKRSEWWFSCQLETVNPRNCHCYVPVTANIKHKKCHRGSNLMQVQSIKFCPQFIPACRNGRNVRPDFCGSLPHRGFVDNWIYGLKMVVWREATPFICIYCTLVLWFSCLQRNCFLGLCLVSLLECLLVCGWGTVHLVWYSCIRSVSVKSKDAGNLK